MDVRSRISHGLSQEGYSFTKYFLLEMAFLFVGFLTFVSEIQEFCVFAWIGLVIDFYMQVKFFGVFREIFKHWMLWNVCLFGIIIEFLLNVSVLVSSC